MAGKFSVEAIFKATDRFSRPVAAMQAQTERFQKSTKRGFMDTDRVISGVATGIKRVAGAAVVATGVAAVALKEVVDTGATFEKTLVGAAAKFSPEIRKGTAEFERLRLTAEAVGASTEFNAQQAAAGLKDLASAGFGVNQAIAALPGVVDLATAAEVDLAVASEIAGKSLGAFGLKTEDATQLGINLARVNDTLSRTADKTSASIDGLFESIKTGGPVATTAGASIETFLAMAGQLSEAGIEGENAGTTLKNVFLSLAAPTNEAAAALKKLKINTLDAKTGNLRDMVELFGELEEKTKGMGTGAKAATLEQIFGKIPIAGVSALLDGGTDKIAALRGELEKAGGSTAKMAAIMRDTTQGDIDGFTSAIDGIKIAIFGVLSGPLRGILKGISEWASANRELIASGVEKFFARIGQIARAVAPLLAKFFSGFGSNFSTTIGDVSAGFDGLLKRIQTPEFEAMAERWGKRLGVVADMLVKVAGAVVDIIPDVMLLADTLQQPQGFVLELLAGTIGKAFQVLGVVIKFVANTLRALLTFAYSVPKRISSAFGRAAAAISSAFEAVKGFVGSVFERIKAIAMPFVEFFVGLMAITVRGLMFIWSPIGSFFSTLWSGVSAIAVAAWNYLSSFFALAYSGFLMIWSPVGAFFAGLWDGVKSIAETAWNGFLEFATITYDGFVMIWSPLVDFFSGLWDQVASIFNATLGGIISRIESAVNAVREIGRAALGGDGGEGPQVVGPGTREGVDVSGEISVNAPAGTSVSTPKGSPVGLKLNPSGAM
jgi:TP901 family phage tail tape measure protein